MTTETKTYTGETGAANGGFDGFAGLIISKSYTGTIEGDTVHITLPNGRPTSVSVEQWAKWFR